VPILKSTSIGILSGDAKHPNSGNLAGISRGIGVATSLYRAGHSETRLGLMTLKTMVSPEFAAAPILDLTLIGLWRGDIKRPTS